ncbi:MAG: energy transducer TonB [Selenomonadaceae bacterium]|nr:energy transducer TonB [Selenomonadaceae bacterium]
MSGYSTRWRATILASVAFHFLAAAGFSYILPHLLPEQQVANVAQFEWVDVDLLPPDAVPLEAEGISAEEETLPIFNAQDLFIPDLTIPEPIIAESPPLEIKPIEPPKLQPPPQVVKPEPEIKKESETNSEKEAVSPAENKQFMGSPPMVVKEVYPEEGSGLGFRGQILIAVTIGKDGKVKNTEIVQSSGRLFVDEIARKAVMQWTFRPALDQTGRPMACSKIISFDFKNSSR